MHPRLSGLSSSGVDAKESLRMSASQGRGNRRPARSGGHRRLVIGMVVAGIALIAILLVGHHAARDGSPDTTAATAPARSADAATETFAITAYQGQATLGGSEIDFSSLLGRGRPVILNFWAGLCPPCRAEMPGFQRVYEEHRDDVILVGVDVGPFTGLGSHADAQQLLRALNITYPAGFATNARALQTYRVTGMPTTVFFDREGRVHSSRAGLLDEQTLRAEVAALLATP